MARQVAGLAFGVIGGFVGGIFTAGAFSGIGFSLGSALGGSLFAKKPKHQQAKPPEVQGSEVPFFGTEYYGIVGEVRGNIIDCARDDQGKPAGVLVVERTEKQGGKGGGVKTIVDDFFLTCAFFISNTITTGAVWVDRIQIEDGEGRRTIYDRAGNTGADKGYTLTPQTGVGGAVIAEVSDVLRLYPGSAQQPPDSALAEYNPDGQCAYRNSSYCVVNKLPVTSIPEFYFTIRCALTGRKTICRAKMKQSGIPAEHIYLNQIGGNVEGAWVNNEGGAKDFIVGTAQRVHCELAFDGLRLRDQSRLAPLVHEIDEIELGAQMVKGAREGQSGADGEAPGEDSSDGQIIQLKAEDELLSRVDVAYRDIDLNYDDTQASAPVYSARHSNPQSFQIAECDRITPMIRFARALREEALAADRTWEGSLLPGHDDWLAGDVARVTSRLRRADGALLERVDDWLLEELETTADDILIARGTPWRAGVYTQTVVVATEPRPLPTVAVPGAPLLFFCECPPLLDVMQNEVGALVAASQTSNYTWGNGVIIEATSGLSILRGAPIVLNQKARMGETLGAFSLGDCYGYDFARTLDVLMYAGAPQTADEADVRAGANLLLFENGRIISFIASSQTAQGEFELSGLKDGRFGSDAGPFADTIPSGARFILLTDHQGERDAAIQWSARRFGDLGRTINYQGYNSGFREIYSAAAHTYTGDNLKPIAPVNVHLTRDGSAGAKLRARLRTRIADDGAWETSSPGRLSDPLKVEVILTNGSTTQTLLRDVAAVDFEIVWSVAELATIFGATPATLSGSVAGRNDLIGSGHKRNFAQE